MDPQTCQCKDIQGYLNGGKRPGKCAKQHLIVDCRWWFGSDIIAQLNVVSTAHRETTPSRSD